MLSERAEGCTPPQSLAAPSFVESVLVDFCAQLSSTSGTAGFRRAPDPLPPPRTSGMPRSGSTVAKSEASESTKACITALEAELDGLAACGAAKSGAFSFWMSSYFGCKEPFGNFTTGDVGSSRIIVETSARTRSMSSLEIGSSKFRGCLLALRECWYSIWPMIFSKGSCRVSMARCVSFRSSSTSIVSVSPASSGSISASGAKMPLRGLNLSALSFAIIAFTRSPL